MEKVHVEPTEIADRLLTMGLDEQPILGAVGGGQLAIDNCTDNHPPMYAGLSGWAETIRGLRDYLVPLGWWNSDDSNYARVVNADGTIAIAVATGNEDTGIATGAPTTKAAKGLCTVEAVAVNAAQADLFPDLLEKAKAQRGEPRESITWILLIHRAPNEIRAELSLPVAIGPDMRVCDWRERIILRSISRDSEPLRRIEPPVQPDLDIQVTRKTRK